MENVFRKTENEYHVSWNMINKRSKDAREICYDYNISFSDDEKKACTIISTIDGVKEMYTLSEESLVFYFESLEKRETLSRDFVESVRKLDACTCDEKTHEHEYRIIQLYRHALACLKEEDKARRFEKSGVLFIYKGEELRFRPVYCTDGVNEYVLFKTITGDGVCYLKRDNATCVFGVYGKGGKNATLKADLIENNTSLLRSLFNDMFNAMPWDTLIELCHQVENFGTCSVPKVLR